jgi:DNA-binding SARP family transcriptional activator
MLRLALGVLGPLEVSVGDRRLDLPRLRLRALLALLVADAGRVVSVGALTAGLWPGVEPPPDAERTVRSYVSRLRTALAGAGAPATTLIVTRAPRYLLAVDPDAVDAARFERLVVDARCAMRDGEPRLAADRLAAALGLWRGEPYGEFDAPVLRAEAVRLQRVRLAAVQDRVDADLGTGLGPELVAELEQLTGRHPGHERLWGQLLLLAPLSFALQDPDSQDPERVDPIRLLEAVRRYADRTTVFCQAGAIHLPAQYPATLRSQTLTASFPQFPILERRTSNIMA